MNNKLAIILTLVVLLNTAMTIQKPLSTIDIHTSHLTCQDAGITLVGEYHNLSVVFVVNGVGKLATFNEATDGYTSYSLSFPTAHGDKVWSNVIINEHVYTINKTADCPSNDPSPDETEDHVIFLPIVLR